VENVGIRRLRLEDVEEIGKIQEQITQSAVTPDFLDIVREYAGKPENACFVAERDSRIVGFMISRILSFFKTLGFDRSDFINLRRVLE